ncbi:MAG TPA: beta-phosphoglucomutase family hydrolase [Kofleriaceae bacterium]|nr:beta-phosphoglucomutase family hydrolase [Kofleriaceae bacterium]
MRDVRLVLADVDGTLVAPDKRLTTESIAAARRLRAHGIDLAIASGRPPRGMAPLVEALALTTPVAAFNGGLIIAPDLRTILVQHTVPAAVAREVVDALHAAGLDVWVYRGNDWFVRDRHGVRVASEQATVQFAPTAVEDVRAVLDGAVKIVGVGDDHALVARCERELRDRVGGDVSAARSQPYYLDVTHPDANKGAVVRELAHRLDIAPAHIAVIGDMPTDVLMFGLAGTSIAMGNASLDVQRCARFVTTSNQDEGFARAIDRYVLRGATPVQARLGLPSRIEACLFDVDGVLTQTAVLHAAAWKQAFDEVLHAHSQPPFDAVAEYAHFVDGRPREDGVRTFLAARNIAIDHDDVRAIAERKDAFLEQLLRERPVATYAGSVRYLRAVRDGGLKTAVVSSSKHADEVLRSAGIADLFDVRIDGNIAEQRHLAGKPAPDTYLAAADALAVEPARAVVFEDAIAGVEAGHAGHFGYVVGVDRAGQAAALCQHGADLVVRDLAMLLETS